jgi:hypothetical protein
VIPASHLEPYLRAWADALDGLDPRQVGTVRASYDVRARALRDMRELRARQNSPMTLRQLLTLQNAAVAAGIVMLLLYAWAGKQSVQAAVDAESRYLLEIQAVRALAFQYQGVTYTRPKSEAVQKLRQSVREAQDALLFTGFDRFEVDSYPYQRSTTESPRTALNNGLSSIVTTLACLESMPAVAARADGGAGSFVPRECEVNLAPVWEKLVESSTGEIAALRAITPVALTRDYLLRTGGWLGLIAVVFGFAARRELTRLLGSSLSGSTAAAAGQDRKKPE